MKAKLDCWQILFWKNILIRSKSDHYIAKSVTRSKLDWYDYGTCKNVNWKLVDVASDEEHINDSLVEKLKFGQDIKAEFFVTFFVQTWSTEFSQDLEILILGQT